MVRKGKLDIDLSIKTVKMYMPEEYKDTSAASYEACRGVGKKM